MVRKPIVSCAAAVVVSLAAACSHKPSAEEQAEIRKKVQAAVARKAPPFASDDASRGHVWKEVGRFYAKNEHQLVWSDARRPRKHVDALLETLRAAGAEGLDPQAYGVGELDAARQSFDRENAIDFDVRHTYAYIRHAWDLTQGRIDPKEVMPRWYAVRRPIDLHGPLLAAVKEGRIAAALAGLAPQAPQYLGLKRQLELARTRGAAAAVEQIARNMERWRWLPDDLGANYVLVNIPAFRLDVIENGKSVLGMKVVTGKKENPTPVLADTMETIVFSPYWNIPESIVQNEILPKLASDPTYLERNNMEVDESGLRYRQRPGRGNSLGQVKFVFPNHYNVYLHGTPSQSLFNRVERDFSHGCVRLERPLDLAKYVLRDQPEWSDERIVAAMNRGVERAVPLKRPLPVYLVYFTAWEEDGALKTVADVYGLDRRHVAAAAAAS